MSIDTIVNDNWPAARSAGAAARQLVRDLKCAGTHSRLVDLLEALLGEMNADGTRIAKLQDDVIRKNAWLKIALRRIENAEDCDHYDREWVAELRPHCEPAVAA